MRTSRALALAFTSAALLGGAAACGDSTQATAAPSASTSAGGSALGTGTDQGTGGTAANSPAPGGQTGGGQGSGGTGDSGTGGTGSGGTGTGGSGTGSTPTTGGTPAAPAPQIVSFVISQQPQCAEGDAVFRAPPMPIKLSWQAVNATGVTLSIDGPGAYASYGPTDGVTLSFACGALGSTVTHTYMLTTNGGTGPADSKTVTASATQR